MLIFWLHNYAPTNVTKIVLTFPVRGHSFLPADRVFGRVEKDLRKKPFILNPKTYQDVYEKHGKVHNLAEDWHLYDVKQLESYYKKVENIRDAKRIILERKSTLTEAQNVTGDSSNRTQGRGRVRRRSRGSGRRHGTVRGVRGRNKQSAALTHINYGVKVTNFYNTDENQQNAVSLLKPSQNHPTLLRRLPTVNEIKQQKKKDVEQILIKQFGEEWSENAELEWFKTNIFSASAANTGAHNDGDDVDENYQECDCCEPDMQNFI